jgi:Family of unknown function (DUF6328)
MLIELRILLPGAKLLTALLITLPFSSGFARISQGERWIFLASFIFSLVTLVLFTVPAIQHRQLRPLNNCDAFKNTATRQMVAGAIALSLALILSADLVISEVFGPDY